MPRRHLARSHRSRRQARALSPSSHRARGTQIEALEAHLCPNRAAARSSRRSNPPPERLLVPIHVRLAGVRPPDQLVGALNTEDLLLAPSLLLPLSFPLSLTHLSLQETSSHGQPQELPRSRLDLASHRRPHPRPFPAAPASNQDRPRRLGSRRPQFAVAAPRLAATPLESSFAAPPSIAALPPFPCFLCIANK